MVGGGGRAPRPSPHSELPEAFAVFGLRLRKVEKLEGFARYLATITINLVCCSLPGLELLDWHPDPPDERSELVSHTNRELGEVGLVGEAWLGAAPRAVKAKDDERIVSDNVVEKLLGFLE